MIHQRIIDIIKKTRQSPIIGIIGATIPSKEYSSSFGFEVGQSLREWIEVYNGSIFTGGVDGVGIDAFSGIINYCSNKFNSDKKFPISKTFLLIPYFYDIVIKDENAYIIHTETRQYDPPKRYSELASIINENLDIVRVGENMKERRDYVGNIADFLIMINGGPGTLDEALMGASNGKPVIAFENTGGASKFIKDLKKHLFHSEPDKNTMQLIRQYENKIDPDLLYSISSIDEMVFILEKLSKK